MYILRTVNRHILLNISEYDQIYIFIQSFFGEYFCSRCPFFPKASWAKNFLQCVTPTFFNKKRWKSGTLWEHLPKIYYFWTSIIKQKNEKVGHFGVRHFGVRHFGVRHFGVRHFGVMDCTMF